MREFSSVIEISEYLTKPTLIGRFFLCQFPKIQGGFNNESLHETYNVHETKRRTNSSHFRGHT